MQTFITIITTSLIFAPIAFAHEEEKIGEEFTNLAEADWLGPIIGLLIIIAAIIIAKMLQKKSNSK